MSGEVINKNSIETDIIQYICHSILMMRRSGSEKMNRPMLSKYAFLVAAGSFHVTKDIDKSLFKYLNFNTQLPSGICCNICADYNAMYNLDTLELYKIEDEYFKEFRPRTGVDWYNILSDRLGDIKYLIDESLNLLFELNPLIIEYDFMDLRNIAKSYRSVGLNIECMKWIEKPSLKYYASQLVEYDKEIIADCWYYKNFYSAISNNEPDKLIMTHPHLYTGDYPYIDLINLYPEHPLYNKPIVNKYPVKSRMNNRKHCLYKFPLF